MRSTQAAAAAGRGRGKDGGTTQTRQGGMGEEEEQAGLLFPSWTAH